MTAKFKRTDLVKLPLPGAPVMIVREIGQKTNGAVKTDATVYTCIWFDSHQKIQVAAFMEDELNLFG